MAGAIAVAVAFSFVASSTALASRDGLARVEGLPGPRVPLNATDRLEEHVRGDVLGGITIAEPTEQVAVDGFVVASEGNQMTGFCWTKIHRDAEPPVGAKIHPDRRSASVQSSFNVGFSR